MPGKVSVVTVAVEYLFLTIVSCGIEQLVQQKSYPRLAPTTSLAKIAAT